MLKPLRREDFRAMTARRSGGFTFDNMWWNVVREKDDEYRGWFFDTIICYGVFGVILCDLPDRMKVDLKDIIGQIYFEILHGDNPLRYSLGNDDMIGIDLAKEEFDRQVKDIKMEGA